jgi:hypothetical protein
MRIYACIQRRLDKNIVCLRPGIFGASILCEGCVFNLTTEEEIFVGGEVGFFEGACMKHKQQLKYIFM